jgi:hypothetical protein
MSAGTDPMFYRSPAEAIAAPPERLAYVAAFDPAGRAKDAMTVLDCDPSSPDYGRVVGWSELPTAGNELHATARSCAGASGTGPTSGSASSPSAARGSAGTCCGA